MCRIVDVSCLSLFVWQPAIFLLRRKSYWICSRFFLLINRPNLRFAVISNCSIYFSVTLGENGLHLLLLLLVVVLVRRAKTSTQAPQMLVRRNFQKMLNRALLPLLLIRKTNQRNTKFIQNTPFKRTVGHFTPEKKWKISYSSKFDQYLYICTTLSSIFVSTLFAYIWNKWLKRVSCLFVCF